MPAKCKDCGLIYDSFDGHMVMLHNPLWYKVSKSRPQICLCDTCIEKRLGRQLTTEDLIPGVTVNNWYIQKHLTH